MKLQPEEVEGFLGRLLLTSTVVMAALATMPARAQDATWVAATASIDFNNPANWSTGTVPTGIASFGGAPATVADPGILGGATNTLNQIQFLAPPQGALQYTIGVFGTLNLVGVGVTNPSGTPQGIVVLSGGILNFNNSSSAGDSSTIGYANRGGTINFNNGATAGSANFENQTGGGTTGIITFNNSSSAGSSIIRNDVGAGIVIFAGASTAGSANILNESTGGGEIIFAGTSTAGSAVIQNLVQPGNTITFQNSSNAGSASISNAAGSTITFTDSANAAQSQIVNPGTLNFNSLSSAGSSTITNTGTTTFSGSATADHATITTNSGGVTSFSGSSTGGVARFITSAGGTFDMSPLTSGAMTAGSIEGEGNYFLGANELTTGLNNLSTTVSGVIADGGAAGGTGGSLIKVGTGTLTLTGANTYTGPTTVIGGTLAAGAVDTFSAASHTVVQTGGTLALQGFNQTLDNGLENAGTVQLGVPSVTAPGTTLTVASNYVGTNGILALNTFLGTDGSPSDKLIINGGTATGGTSILVANVGGPGLLTTANGILVVNAINGATTPGAFTLANPELRAGAFDYRLFQGGLNGSDPNDWFLRSTFVEETPTPPTLVPIIGPELATYGVVQPVARQLGLTTLGTFHERFGDASADAACLSGASTGCCATPDGAAIIKAPPVPYGNCRPAVWGRLFGQQIDNHYQAFADPRASGQVAGIQTGIDVWRGSLIPGHSDVAGLYFAYGNGNVGVDGLVTNAAATAYVLQHTGSVNLNAYSVGGYWTHYGPGGWYIDTVLQGSFYNGNAATQFANLPTNGTGFISSLETGYPIPLPWFGPRFVLEPEGQIIWQRVSFDDANDGLGPVGLGTTSGASARLGLRGKWTINDPAGRVWQPYVLANVWRDWGANATTMFGIDPVPLLEQATRLEFAGGLSAKILPGLSLYAQAGYQFAVSGTDGGRRDGVKGDFGVRYSW